MNRLDYFLSAMRAEEFRRTAWVISAFSQTMENQDAWKSDPYPYRLVQTPSGFYFVDPSDVSRLVMITDAEPGRALFQMKEKVAVPAGGVQFTHEDMETTYGNLLFNHIVVIYPFQGKIPYQHGRITADHMESLILPRLVDDPLPEDPVVKTALAVSKIYISEYLKFCDAMFSLMAYTQLCVIACTPKTITSPPGVKELRTRLLEENKNRLHDPAVIAKIDAELVAYLKNWMKDDPGMGFLISEKSFSNVRRKLYLMGGAEMGMDDNNTVHLVEKSLSEGWDPKSFAAMATASRAGSFSRGAQTELGGEAVKWLFRASSNMTVTAPDCGSQQGIRILTGPKEADKLLGFTALVRGEQVKITQENVDNYLGKIVTLRSPMYCKMEKTDFCATCLGDRLSTSPTGLSAAVAEYGSTFMAIMLKIMHSTELKLAKMNYRDALI